MAAGYRSAQPPAPGAIRGARTGKSGWRVCVEWAFSSRAVMDDPEGQKVFTELCGSSEERIRVLSVQVSALVNALQQRATVVLQKSVREGFGLTVAEAMWKGAAVIGGRAGGIPHQIEDGVNGFLVETVAQAAERIVQLVKDPELRRRLGARARETVRARFLMTRLMEDWLDLIGSFEASFRLKDSSGA